MNENISLRDYFAAQAMQALRSDKHLGYKDDTQAFIAERAYAMADEMMKAREKQPTK